MTQPPYPPPPPGGTQPPYAPPPPYGAPAPGPAPPYAPPPPNAPPPPQYAPPPGYPPPPPAPYGYAPQPPKKSPTTAVAIGAVVVIGALVTLYFTVLKEDSASSAGPRSNPATGGGTAGSPEAAVRGFIGAVLRQDCNAVIGFFSSATRRQIQEFEDAARQSGQSINFRGQFCASLSQARGEADRVDSVATKSDDGVNAVVTVRIRTKSGGVEEEDVRLVLEAASWKVDLTQELGNLG